MNPPSVDIRDMLEADSSLGLVAGTNLFVGREPAKPRNVVTVFDTHGMPPQLTFSQGEDYFYPAVQVRIRNVEYQDAWELAEDIRESLHARGHETWNGAVYQVIYCSSGPAFLDWDKNHRARVIVNFNIQRVKA